MKRPDLAQAPPPRACGRSSVVTRDGFETALRVPGNARHAAAQALDVAGAVLARSPTVAV